MSGASASASTESPGPPRLETLNQNQAINTTKVCKFFVKNQTCQFGNKCRFLHPKESYPVYVQRSFAVDNGAVSEEFLQPHSSKPKVYIPPHRIQHRANHEAVRKQKQAEETLPVNQNTFGQACKFFSRNGFCKFGDNCKYLHERDGGEEHSVDVGEEFGYHGNYGGRRGGGRGGRGRRDFKAQRGRKTFSQGLEAESTTFTGAQDSSANNRYRNKGTVHYNEEWAQNYNIDLDDESNADLGDKEKSAGDGTKKSDKKVRKQLCRYYKRGYCRQGEKCKFWHPSDLPDLSGNEEEENPTEKRVDGVENLKITSRKDATASAASTKREIVQPCTEFSIETLTEDEAAKQRVSEINTLMKRYPRAQPTQLPRRDEEAYKIEFVPSDPDWPFDVKEIQLTILFPESYPCECMIVKLPRDQPLPDTVRRYLYGSITDWIQKRYDRLVQRMRVELLFRPFMRWLDKNAQDLFTGGLKQYQRELMAKAAGIEIVTAGELRERYEQDSDAEYSEESEEDDGEDDEYSDDESDGAEDEDDTSDEGGNEKRDSDDGKTVDPMRKGTEIKLHNLQLRDGAVTLMGLKLHLVIQCDRCKNKDEISVRQNQGVSLVCGRCSNTCLVAFRPAVIHQFSAVLGYLDLKECHAFDLVLMESEFMVGCEKCDKEMKVQGISPGQPRDLWCLHCHQKLKIIVETTRFLNLQPNELTVAGIEAVTGKKVRKMVKDPAIKEGLPLPDTGTCRHYKKSFRWLRFPCCGKAYPCDVCHDEKEDHEMVFANRMICGFCAKEQHFAADRPCKNCDASMTKKFSTHWEGGKGCRDKIKMSRGDERKYANSNKTISRRAQEKKSTGKKTTKLRHS